MTVPATGLFKKLAFLAESSFGVLPSPTTGGQYLRRQQSTLSPDAQFFKSAEINFDRQLRDNRKGLQTIKGDITGEMSPGTYQSFMQAMLAASAATAAVTTGAQIDITAAAGPPGTFTTAGSINFLTLGFKLGDIVRCTGWTTTGAANNARNYRITTLTATVMTVGTAMTGATGGAEVVAAKAAGDSVTIAQVGKKIVSPSTNLADTSFCIEQWYSDISKSEVFLGCKPSQMSLNMPATAIATLKTTFMGQSITAGNSQVLTTPTALTTSGLLAGVNGSLMVNGTDYGTITALTININGNHSTQAVVGSQQTPGVFPGILDISGTVTALFDSTTLRDAFLAETDYQSIHAVLVTSQAINADFIAFNIPRAKFTSATKDDKPGVITQTLNFQAALNVVGGSGVSSDLSTMTIQDSLAS